MPRVICAAVVVAFISVFLGCNNVKKCNDDLETAAFRELSVRLGDYGKGAFHSYLYNDSKESLDNYQSKLSAPRTWAEKQTDKCVRDAYSHWLDYYQRQLNESYDELRTHKERNEAAQRSAEREAEDARVKAIQKSGKFPVPPRELP